MLPPLVVPKLPAKAQEKLPTAAWRSVVLSKPVTRPKSSMIGTGMTVPLTTGKDDCGTGLRPTPTFPGAAPLPFVTTSVSVTSGVMAKVPTSPPVARSGPFRPTMRNSLVVSRVRVSVSGKPSPSVSANPEASSHSEPFQRQIRLVDSTNRSSPSAISEVSVSSGSSSVSVSTTDNTLVIALPRM